MECREPQAGVLQGEGCSWKITVTSRLEDGLGWGHIGGKETSWETTGVWFRRWASLKEEKQGLMRAWGLRGERDGFKGFGWSYQK